MSNLISPGVSVTETHVSYFYHEGIRYIDWFRMFRLMEKQPDKVAEIRDYYEQHKDNINEC